MVQVTTLVALLIGFVRGHGYEPSVEDVARYDRLAHAIETVVTDPFESLPFEGPGRREASAVLFTAIAAHESYGRADVLDCRVMGDHGRAAGAFQVQRGVHWERHSKAEICSSLELQTRIALHAMMLDRLTTRGWEAAVHAYATGSPHLETPGARGIAQTFRSFVRETGLKVRLGWADAVEEPEALRVVPAPSSETASADEG